MDRIFLSFQHHIKIRYFLRLQLLFLFILPVSYQHLLAQPTFTKIDSGDVVQYVASSFGASWADYDSDGDLDLFVTNYDFYNQLYRNDNGIFNRIEVDQDMAASTACSWGDYDNDGYLDLFVSNDGNNFLYHNNGDSLSRIMEGPIVSDGGVSWGASWSDYDNDGDVDLFVANSGENNFLYQNNGDGSFTPITEGDIVNDTSNSRGVSWGDYDNDGDPDLFIANWGENNLLYRNDDSCFTKISSGAIVNDGGNSRGGSWGDYDNDGDLDLFVTNEGMTVEGEDNFLYQNNGDPQGSGLINFTKITEGDIVTDAGTSQGATWGDYDNDGDLDLFVANKGEDNFLYQNNGAPQGSGQVSFTRITEETMVKDGEISHGCIWGDYNNDGYLDLFVGNSGQDGHNFLYRSNGTSNHWLHIQLIGTVSNTAAIGAKVKLKASINGEPVWQMRELSGQTGYLSQNSLITEFGLGDATTVDSVIVEWPDPRLAWVTTNVAADQLLKIVEAQPVSVQVDSTIFNFLQKGKDFTFEVSIENPSHQPIDAVILFVRQGGQTIFNNGIPLTEGTSGLWSGIISGDQITERGLEYYLKVVYEGNTTLFPEQGKINPATASVNIARLSFDNQTLENRYQMFSIPANTFGQTLKDLFGDELGPYDSTRYRIFDYEKGTPPDDYIELNSLEDSLPPGKALWLITKTPKLLTVEDVNGPVQSVRTDRHYIIELKEGWNMVAVPFAFPVEWASVEIPENTVQGRTLNFFDGRQWSLTDTLQPFKGYAVKATANTQMKIPPIKATGSLPGQPTPFQLGEDEWQIQIKAERGEFKDLYNFAGVRTEATNQLDIQDIGEPPPIGDYLSLYFQRNDGIKRQRLSGDFRSPLAEGFEYELTMISNVEGTTDLTFIPQNLPKDFDWQVVSPETKVKYPEREINTSLNRQQYLLIVGTTEFLENALLGYHSRPTEFKLSQNYPNPFNPETLIPFQLPQTERVTLMIYNVLGQRVKTLLKNELKQAGYYTTRWDGTTDAGYRVANGIYILNFRSENFVRSVKMVLVR